MLFKLENDALNRVRKSLGGWNDSFLQRHLKLFGKVFPWALAALVAVTSNAMFPPGRLGVELVALVGHVLGAISILKLDLDITSGLAVKTSDIATVTRSWNWPRWAVRYFAVSAIARMFQFTSRWLSESARPVHLSSGAVELYEKAFLPRNFSLQLFDRIAQYASVRTAKKGDWLVRPGKELKEVLIIVRGQCREEMGSGSPNSFGCTVGPSSIIGESVFLQSKTAEGKSKTGQILLKEGAGLRACESTTYWSWSIARLDQLLRDPSNRDLAQQLRSLVDRAEKSSGFSFSWW